MAGLLGGMNLRKPNIPANTGGAIAQGVVNGVSLWENIQRNAQWNMTKDITSMTNYGNIALDSNKPTNTRISAAHNYNNLAKKIDPNYRDMFFNENQEFYPMDEVKELNKKMSNIMKGKDPTSQKLVDISGLLNEYSRFNEFPQYKGIVEKGEDEAAKQGLLGLNPDKFGIPSWKTSPTIENSLANTQRDERIGLLTSQPYDYLKGIATAEPKLPPISKEEESNIAVREYKEKRDYEIANPLKEKEPKEPIERKNKKDYVVEVTKAKTTLFNLTKSYSVKFDKNNLATIKPKAGRLYGEQSIPDEIQNAVNFYNSTIDSLNTAYEQSPSSGSLDMNEAIKISKQIMGEGEPKQKEPKSDMNMQEAYGIYMTDPTGTKLIERYGQESAKKIREWIKVNIEGGGVLPSSSLRTR